MLSEPRTGRGPALHFRPDVKTWFSRVMAGRGIRPAPFTAEIAIEASCLPGNLHGDPGDRLLIATSRHFAMPIVTRDYRRILDCAAAGWVHAIAC